jgi:hypothetical protein
MIKRPLLTGWGGWSLEWLGGEAGGSLIRNKKNNCSL